MLLYFLHSSGEFSPMELNFLQRQGMEEARRYQAIPKEQRLERIYDLIRGTEAGQPHFNHESDSEFDSEEEEENDDENDDESDDENERRREDEAIVEEQVRRGHELVERLRAQFEEARLSAERLAEEQRRQLEEARLYAERLAEEQRRQHEVEERLRAQREAEENANKQNFDEEIVSLEAARKKFGGVEAFILKTSWDLFQEQNENPDLKSWDKFSFKDFLDIVVGVRAEIGDGAVDRPVGNDDKEIFKVLIDSKITELKDNRIKTKPIANIPLNTPLAWESVLMVSLHRDHYETTLSLTKGGDINYLKSAAMLKKIVSVMQIQKTYLEYKQEFDQFIDNSEFDDDMKDKLKNKWDYDKIKIEVGTGEYISFSRVFMLCYQYILDASEEDKDRELKNILGILSANIEQCGIIFPDTFLQSCRRIFNSEDTLLSDKMKGILLKEEFFKLGFIKALTDSEDFKGIISAVEGGVDYAMEQGIDGAHFEISENNQLLLEKYKRGVEIYEAYEKYQKLDAEDKPTPELRALFEDYKKTFIFYQLSYKNLTSDDQVEKLFEKSYDLYLKINSAYTRAKSWKNLSENASQRVKEVTYGQYEDVFKKYKDAKDKINFDIEGNDVTPIDSPSMEEDIIRGIVKDYFEGVVAYFKEEKENDPQVHVLDNIFWERFIENSPWRATFENIISEVDVTMRGKLKNEVAIFKIKDSDIGYAPPFPKGKVNEYINTNGGSIYSLAADIAPTLWARWVYIKSKKEEVKLENKKSPWEYRQILLSWVEELIEEDEKFTPEYEPEKNTKEIMINIINKWDPPAIDDVEDTGPYGNLWTRIFTEANIVQEGRNPGNLGIKFTMADIIQYFEKRAPARRKTLLTYITILGEDSCQGGLLKRGMLALAEMPEMSRDN